MMATMLQVFDLRQRKDPSGKDIPLNIEWDDALVWYADSDLHYAVLLTINMWMLQFPASISVFNHTEV